MNLYNYQIPDNNKNKIDKEIPGDTKITQSREQDRNIKDNSADMSERSERSDGTDDVTKQSSSDGARGLDFVNKPFEDENGNTKDYSAKTSNSGDNNKLPNAGRINRIAPHSDIWICEDCSLRGDKWYMLEHNCKGLKN